MGALVAPMGRARARAPQTQWIGKRGRSSPMIPEAQSGAERAHRDIQTTSAVASVTACGVAWRGHRKQSRRPNPFVPIVSHRRFAALLRAAPHPAPPRKAVPAAAARLFSFSGYFRVFESDREERAISASPADSAALRGAPRGITPASGGAARPPRPALTTNYQLRTANYTRKSWQHCYITSLQACNGCSLETETRARPGELIQ